MRNSVAIAFSLALLTTVVTFAIPASACKDGGNCDSAPGRTKKVPGPIAGAGLPVLAAGYGIYWLVRRRRNSQ